MEVNIKNNVDGQVAEVTKNGQLAVLAETISQQHFISHKTGLAFQAEGYSATLTSATHTVLQIINNDPIRDMIISYMRLQLIGANASDALTDYFQLGFGRTVASGGSAVTPTNMNKGSGAVPAAVVTEGSPTMAGTFVGFDTWHPDSSGARNTYNKSGSLILGLGETLEARYVSTATAGKAYARISFMMAGK